MLVKRYSFDEDKLARMVEAREASYAALMRLSDRLQEARDTLHKAKDALHRWEHKGSIKRRATPPRQLTEPVEKYKAEYDVVHAQQQRAETRWQALAAIVDPLKQAASEFVSSNGGTSTIEARGTGAREATRSSLFSGAA